MNSRERLLYTIRRQPTDRVPVSTYELVGYNSHSFENQEESYRPLMDFIREKTDCIAMWNPRSNETFLSSSYPVEIDTVRTREEGTDVIEQTMHTPKGDLHRVLKVMDDVKTVWQIEHWCKDLDDVDKAMSIPYVPIKHDASDLARIKAEVGDNGIIMASTGDPLLIAGDLMEFGEFTVWAMTETDHYEKTVRTIHERYQEQIKDMMETCVVDLYRICGPEYATPPYLPPSFFERFVLPFDREQTELIHSYGGLVRMHCHGKVGRVLDFIRDTGVDAIDPVEAPPDGDIELAEVKKRVGDDLCIFGNVQLKLLEIGSEDQVRAEVRKCMDSAKVGGGYVIMPTAAPINIPLAPKTQDNYMAYIDEALKLGAY